MKKVLYGTTALVAAGLIAGQVQAAEPIKLSVSGYMIQNIGYADNDDVAGTRKYTGWDIISNSEVYFRGSTKLDNGITVGADMRMEADTSNTNVVDESFLYLTSDSLGTLRLGGNDTITASTQIRATDVGIGLTGAAAGVGWARWIVAPSNHTNTPNTYFNVGDDSARLTYVTPTFEGFSAGYTFSPDINSQVNNGPIRNSNGNGNKGIAHSVVANYGGKFEDIGINLHVGYTNSGSTTTPGLDVVQGGVRLTYAGFTLSGGIADYDAENSSSAETLTDGQVWDIGLSYATGPYAISLGYLESELEGSDAVAAEDEVDTIMLSGKYTLGPGVDWKTSIFHTDWEGETTTLANDNDGWAVVTGLHLTF